MIVLPNGFNVYPEDIENALRIAGLRDSVVVETRPGRIEAIVLAGARPPRPAPRPRARHEPDVAALRQDRRDRQGRERPAGPEPADRRLAPLAGRGLPAHAHPQDQACPGSRMGDRRHRPVRQASLA